VNRNEFQILNAKIIKCNKCPRLVSFRKKISINKRKQYKDQKYWGKPITGFGDLNAKILFLGLAPAAHGGTRTGRVFTGDKSSDFLYKCLYKAKISNLNNSNNIDDGLKLKNAFISTALKCVPPKDKPKKEELNNCFNFLKQEINLLKNLKVIIALGRVAFNTCVLFYKKDYSLNLKLSFSHGKKFKLPDGKILMCCYHPSPRNVNTKRINLSGMTDLFIRAKNLI